MPGAYTARVDEVTSWVWSTPTRSIPDTSEIVPTSDPDEVELEVTLICFYIYKSVMF